MMKEEFKEGEKVLWYNKTINNVTNEPFGFGSDVYDFGYYSATKGKCILYEEGECNMQDSFVVDISDIKRKK